MVKASFVLERLAKQIPCHNNRRQERRLGTGGKAEIRAHFSQFLQELRETPRAEGCPRVWIHGEKELESEIRRRREGIPANDKTLAELRRIASDLGLGAPW